MLEKITQKTNLRILLLISTLIFPLVVSSTAVAAQEQIDALNDYCRENFSVSLTDGTDAHIVCRVGDPNDALSQFQTYDTSYWEALSEDEKVAQREKDHCAEIYTDSVIEICRDMTDEHTGIPYEPVTVPIQDTELEVECEASDGEALTGENCPIIGYLVTGINILSALAGMAIVFSIMFAGYQYMTARDNAGQVQQAKQRIIWALTALAVFVFMYALLNFLVPGGVL